MKRGLAGRYENSTTASETVRAFVPAPLPFANLNYVCTRTGLSFPAVSKAMETLSRLNIIDEITGRKRDRIFAYKEYVRILKEGTERL